MSDYERKVWGKTRCVTKTPAFELHRLEIYEGGYCSLHKHATKFNGFMVESGRLVISRLVDGDMHEVEVGPGGYLSVEPGVFHQFEAAERTVAYEVYWSQYDAQDIQRLTVGGMRSQD